MRADPVHGAGVSQRRCNLRRCGRAFQGRGCRGDGMALVIRWVLLCAAWVVLGRTGPADLAMGAVAAAIAAPLSLALVPPVRVAPAAAARLAGRFAWGSLVAGIDVARRVAVTPVRVRPGVVEVACPLAPGLGRAAFCALASLQPGTLPVGGGADSLAVHLLDTASDAAAQLERDAGAFRAAGGERP